MQSLKTWSLAVLAFVALVFNPTSERGRGMIDRFWGAALANAQTISMRSGRTQHLGLNVQAELDRAQGRLQRSQRCALRAQERLMRLQSDRMQRISDRMLIWQDRAKLRLEKVERLQKQPCVNSRHVVLVNSDVPDLSDFEDGSIK